MSTDDQLSVSEPKDLSGKEKTNPPEKVEIEEFIVDAKKIELNHLTEIWRVP